MKESEMGALVVVGAAAVVVGGAAIALTYRCCQDLVANRKEKKKVKDEVEIESRRAKVDSSAQVEDQDRIKLLASSRTKQTTVVGEEKTKRAEVRTVEEIKARYGRPTRKDVNVAAGIAGEARDKLMERGEKLVAVNEKTEELQSEAENFASLAEQLANKMKSRKWWEL